MKRLGVLVALLLLVVGGNAILRYNTTKQEPQQKGKLLDMLTEQANRLVAIKIDNANGPVLHASLQEGQWQSTHLAVDSSFPVDANELKTLVAELANAKIIELKTANPKQFNRLGLDATTELDSSAHLLNVQTDTQQWTLLVGNLSKQGTGRFVKRPKENQTYLVDKSLLLPESPFDWLERPIFDVDIERIQSVELNGAHSWRIERNLESNAWQLAEMAENETLASEWVLGDMVSALVKLDFASVLPRTAVQLNWITAEPYASFVLNTDSQSWRLNVYIQSTENNDGAAWLTVENDTRSWHANWAYQLQDQQREQLLVERSSFLQAEPEQQPALAP